MSIRNVVMLAVVLALLAVGWTFTPATLEPRKLNLSALPSATPPAEMAVSSLPTADLSALAAFAFRGGSFGEPRTFAQTALLVHHPRGDLLFDTGLGAQAREQFEQTPLLMRTFAELTLHEPAAAQLRRAGYDLSQLRGIVPTHAHWDHISGVPDFAEVPVWLNDSERAFIDSDAPQAALMHSFGDIPTRR